MPVVEDVIAFCVFGSAFKRGGDKVFAVVREKRKFVAGEHGVSGHDREVCPEFRFAVRERGVFCTGGGDFLIFHAFAADDEIVGVALVDFAVQVCGGHAAMRGFADIFKLRGNVGADAHAVDVSDAGGKFGGAAENVTVGARFFAESGEAAVEAFVCAHRNLAESAERSGAEEVDLEVGDSGVAEETDAAAQIIDDFIVGVVENDASGPGGNVGAVGLA